MKQSGAQIDCSSSYLLSPSGKNRVHSMALIVGTQHYTGGTQWHNLPICYVSINTLRPRQNGRRFADDTFKRIFLKENVRILITISLRLVPKGPNNNIPALVQIMAGRRSGDKPLSEPMMSILLTHICVTRPHWVNPHTTGYHCFKT